MKQFYSLIWTGFFLGITLFFSENPVCAQGGTAEEYNLFRTESGTRQRPFEGALKPQYTKSEPGEQALEGPIDPETYRLGPGDLLAVYILGDVDQDIQARISADGMLRLQTLGIFDCRDRFFAEIRQEIQQVAERAVFSDLCFIGCHNNLGSFVGELVWV